MGVMLNKCDAKMLELYLEYINSNFEVEIKE